ncbi:MAG: RNA methyltransferase [Candidatus Omnitrophota bacterium]
MRLYGKNPVIERVKADPGSIKKLVLQKQVYLSDIVRETKKAGLTFESLDKKEFNSLAGDVHAQGVFAEVDDFRYAPFESIVKKCMQEKTIPLFLDGITDPQNLGSIIRTLACMGGFSLVLPEHSSAEVNETVLRVASGGENYVEIGKVINIATSVQNIKKKGIKVFGAAIEGKKGDIPEIMTKGAIALVVGSEGKGIRPGVKKVLDGMVALSMDGAQLSYNASIAAAIFCYQIKRAR